MRVNITYSVEFEEVPAKVLEFMKEVDTQGVELSEMYESIVGAVKKDNYTVAVEQMASMRDALASMDARLDDCMHIVAGYSKTLADMAVGSNSKPEYPPEVMEALEAELKRIQEKNNEPEQS